MDGDNDDALASAAEIQMQPFLCCAMSSNVLLQENKIQPPSFVENQKESLGGVYTYYDARLSFRFFSRNVILEGHKTWGGGGRGGGVV